MEVTAAFQGITTPTSDLYTEIHSRGWSVNRVDIKDGQFVAKAKNPHGEEVEKTGRDEKTALAALLTYIVRREFIRQGAWTNHWADQLAPIAKAYSKAPTFDHSAAGAWAELAADCAARAQAIGQQLDIEVTDEPEPYSTPQDMWEDVEKKHHLTVTRANSDHPLWNADQVMNYRIVHDVLGHASAGGDFGWTGENLATAAHMPLLSPSAQAALFTEAVGQAAYNHYYKGHGPQKITFLNEFLQPAQEENNPPGYGGAPIDHSLTPGMLPAGRTALNREGWQNGLIGPDQKVHIWPEGEATHTAMQYALTEKNPVWGNWQRFRVGPDNTIGPYYLDDDQAKLIMEQHPHITVRGYPRSEHTGATIHEHPSGLQIVELDDSEIKPPTEEWERIQGPFMAGERRPFVYHPQDNQVVIGSDSGLYHSQIDPNGFGVKGAITTDKHPSGAQVTPWSVPMEVAKAVGEHFSIPVKDTANQGESIPMGVWSHTAGIKRDPNYRYDTAIVPPQVNAVASYGDPLDHMGLKDVADKLAVPWAQWTTPEGKPDLARIKVAITNAFRAALLSPKKTLRWNAVHYQDLGHVPHDTADPKVYWNALEHARIEHNRAAGIPNPEIAHKRHYEALLDFYRYYQRLHPDMAPTEVKEHADREVMYMQAEIEEKIIGESKEPDLDIIEPKVYRELDKRLKTIVKDDKSHLLYSSEEMNPYQPGADKYGAFIGRYLISVAKVARHADYLAEAALEDVRNHDGAGHHFRQAVLGLDIPYVGPKVVSFAWLLLQPLTSQLATVDTHICDTLGYKQKDVNTPRDYFRLERELQAGRDAAGYGHMPLGQFQWALWDNKRNGEGAHQDHSALKVWQPTPHHTVDWEPALPASALKGQDYVPPEWWQLTEPYRQNEVARWNIDVAPFYPKKKIPWQNQPLDVHVGAFDLPSPLPCPSCGNKKVAYDRLENKAFCYNCGRSFPVNADMPLEQRLDVTDYQDDELWEQYADSQSLGEPKYGSAQTMYHVTPSANRQSIQTNGITPNMPSSMEGTGQPNAVYLFDSPAAAHWWVCPHAQADDPEATERDHAWHTCSKAQDHDIWQVDTSGLHLTPDEWTINAHHTSQPIEPSRVSLMRQHQASALATDDELHLALEVPERIRKRIALWVATLDLNEDDYLDPNEYHITVAYAEHGADDTELHSVTERFNLAGIKFDGKCLKQLGDDGALVIELESDTYGEYAEQVNTWLEEHGADVSRYDGGWTPHITIAYTEADSNAALPPLSFRAGGMSFSVPRKRDTFSPWHAALPPEPLGLAKPSSAVKSTKELHLENGSRGLTSFDLFGQAQAPRVRWSAINTIPHGSMPKWADYLKVKTADYQGWTNWDTWHTKLMMDNDYDLYKFVQKMMETGRWKTPEDVRDWALTHVLAPHNKQAIEDAQEWNDIPEHDRLDHSYEDLKEKNPQAADFVDALGFGEDVSDTEPTLMDPELVNWLEIWQHLVEERDEGQEYDREIQRQQDKGLGWVTNHNDDTNQMRDAMYRFHGAKPEEWFKEQGLKQWDDPRAYHNMHVNIPFEHVRDAPNYNWPNSFIEPATRAQIWQHQREQGGSNYDETNWSDPHIQELVNADPRAQKVMQSGYDQSLSEYTSDLIHSIGKGTAHPYHAQQMQQALTQRGYAPEEIQQMMRQRWRWDPEAKQMINLEPSPPKTQPVNPELDQPGDMTLPEGWTARQASNRLWWKPGDFGRGLYNRDTGELAHWPEAEGEHDQYRGQFGWLDHSVIPFAIDPHGHWTLAEDGWNDFYDDTHQAISAIDPRLKAVDERYSAKTDEPPSWLGPLLSQIGQPPKPPTPSKLLVKRDEDGRISAIEEDEPLISSEPRRLIVRRDDNGRISSIEEDLVENGG